MKRLQLVAALKRKKWSLKYRLFMHRLSYRIYQRPEDALFGFVMVGMFLVQLMLFLGTR